MSTRSPQRCLKCSASSGTVVLRCGHRCPFAAGPNPAAALPAAIPLATATTAPSVSVASDVHLFDIGAIGDLGAAQGTSLTTLDGSFHSPE